MSTMPPGNQSPPPTASPPAWSNVPDMARLPIPGNAEFAVYLIASIVALLVCWIADPLDSGSWFGFFQWTTIAYILSRGVAKASRVLEQ
ncbi:MAG TPA: hypothetical protein VJ645_05210 [Gaiellaceae bacterium]|nr:hypothetical protein [Gaiellaceae bacterium]